MCLSKVPIRMYGRNVMRIRRIACWSAGIVLAVLLAIAAWCVNFIRTENLVSLIQCADGANYPRLQAICKTGIYALRLRPEEVQELKQAVGAPNASVIVYAAASMQDRERAEAMLRFALSRGLDVNSIDLLTGSTALYTAVFANDPVAVGLLLAHGARSDVSNLKNQSPLELAESLQKKFPQEDYRAVVAVLAGDR